jgi:hypothetical protein
VSCGVRETPETVGTLTSSCATQRVQCDGDAVLRPNEAKRPSRPKDRHHLLPKLPCAELEVVAVPGKVRAQPGSQPTTIAGLTRSGALVSRKATACRPRLSSAPAYLPKARLPKTGSSSSLMAVPSLRPARRSSSRWAARNSSATRSRSRQAQSAREGASNTLSCSMGGQSTKHRPFCRAALTLYFYLLFSHIEPGRTSGILVRKLKLARTRRYTSC